MPADLTAAGLIALLREHPGACGMLELRIADDGSRAYSAEFDGLWRDDPPQYIPGFRRWLTGAVVEKHVKLGIGLPDDLGDDREQAWLTNHDYMTKKDANEWTYHPTLLHALLAGLEAHAKQ